MTPFLLDCEHSQHYEACSTRSDSFGRRKKKRRLLPSPSTSSSAQQEHIRRPSKSALQTSQKRSQSAPDASAAVLDSPFNVERSTRQLEGQKRKIPWADTEDLCRNSKKRQLSRITAEASNTTDPAPTEHCERDDTEVCPPIAFPIVHWARTAQWPKDFASMSQEQSSSSKKRPSSSSYTQSFKAGEVPKAHSAAHENTLADHGVHMDELQGRSRAREESKSFCRSLLQSTYPEPQHTAFPLPEFLSVWQRVQKRNEARVYRDLTPLLVPSPELLWASGHQELEHVAEEISVEWTRCKTLGGPRPKPDLAVGIAPSAFDEEEKAKLKNHTAFERATLFTDNIYFPFLLCEAKCGDEGISRADRQNIQSSSVAVNAIIQLFRAVDETKVADLSGQILVFSVSHDNLLVKLYGHFANIDGDKLAFYRYPVASFVLNFEESQGRKRTHDFVREIYHSFYPAHLKRIRDALAAMDDPRNVAMISGMSVEEDESQEHDPSARSSQENSGFKKPGTPASKKQKGALALVREQMAEQQRQSKEQMALLERQMVEQQGQMARQEEHYKEQIKRQEEQYQEQIKLLKQLLDPR
ncbi:hypothetical protein LTR70_007438 [Exophiala xenobiotica]|uniref:DUF7924 domain-containing protein n=1 Tax=Lithohypha guttulata TaxID=1690604 RepID=A0ABR0K4T3_9EURO|nr:hypothetical protein LTR24_006978 [Lithohypha guttulata]KAK5313795.1 hypothetical protein LTR70_007438 [Exophiala xenobiotica]